MQDKPGFWKVVETKTATITDGPYDGQEFQIALIETTSYFHNAELLIRVLKEQGVVLLGVYGLVSTLNTIFDICDRNKVQPWLWGEIHHVRIDNIYTGDVRIYNQSAGWVGKGDYVIVFIPVQTARAGVDLKSEDQLKSSQPYLVAATTV